jgi:trimethylamine--corrinoid protein Co-methyltransferase
MQPRLHFLSRDTLTGIVEEALQILKFPGIKVGSQEAIALLHGSGAVVDQELSLVHLPEDLVLKALDSAPREFYLYNAIGQRCVHYAGDKVHFDPGSSGVHMLDSKTLNHHLAETMDLIRIIQISEMLTEYDAQSTAVVCHDVPNEIGDLYRLYLVLLFSNKPIVTGAFTVETSQIMFELMQISAGNKLDPSRKPRAIFDVCPSPPLNWTRFASQNLIDLARAKIPAQIVSMPLSGATAPITKIGSIVQHAAECLSGIAIHQLANPGAPIVWGGAPAQFDMRYGTTSVGSIDTVFMVIGYAQVGKMLGLPTHAYLVASDAKLIDSQAGSESSISALLGALAGINMISGAGMLDFLACQSLEKLVIDAEAIAVAKRFLDGIKLQTSTMGTEFFTDFTFPGDFLSQKQTRDLFRSTQYLPSAIVDRDSLRSWEDRGRMDSVDRARIRVKEILSSYQRPDLSSDKIRALTDLVSSIARNAGMDELPTLN